MYQNIVIRNTSHNFAIVIDFSKSKNTTGLIYSNLILFSMKSNDNGM